MYWWWRHVCRPSCCMRSEPSLNTWSRRTWVFTTTESETVWRNRMVRWRKKRITDGKVIQAEATWDLSLPNCIWCVCDICCVYWGDTRYCCETILCQRWNFRKKGAKQSFLLSFLHVFPFCFVSIAFCACTLHFLPFLASLSRMVNVQLFLFSWY